MNRLIKDWIEKLEGVKVAKKLASDAEAVAAIAPVPENIRPAEAVDIIEGAIIWYPEYGDFSDELYPCPYWKLVSEPRHYGDDWKAFVASDGCRYGLRGAFVEV